jgi:uncharacterized membrane protein (DUF106 family)
MMAALVQVVVWLNGLANAVGRLLSPVALMPGWLSATLIGIVTGILLLALFKYTSNQKAIKRVRDGIKANMLALKLYKDSARVAFTAQGRLFVGAFRLFRLGLAPLAVMIIPVALLLGQLSLWYQQRPLRVGEEAVVVVALRGDPEEPMPEVSLQDNGAAEVLVGPVRVFSKREICWNLKAREDGLHRLTFSLDDQTAEKELAVGDGFMRVSAQRPGWSLVDVLENPREEPFPPDSPVRSIQVTYPQRPNWTCGSDWWLIYWFVVSLTAAFCFRGVLGVKT